MTEVRGQLESIRGDVASLMTLLAREKPLEPVDKRIHTGLSKALSSKGDDFFSLKASDATARAFHDLCAAVAALPAEYGDFVASALRLTGADPGMVKKWTRRLPHPCVIPEVAKAFDLALSMILGETAPDTEMRVFHVMAGQFARAARIAEAGTSWTSVDGPAMPVREYDDAASVLREAVQAQFAKLDGRHIALMDDRLRKYRPLLFHPELAPVGHTNSQEQQERIIASNERARSEARAYQTGEMGIVKTMESLAGAEVRKIADPASFVAYATDLYFGEHAPLMTLSVGESGEIDGVELDEPSGPTLQ